MSRGDNNIGNLLSSFRRVCSELERNAEVKLMEVKKECKEECVQSEKSLHKFNELMSRIAEVCSEVNTSDVLDLAMKQNLNENTLNLPYEMHSDLVRCINGLYNDTHPAGNELEEKLISEKNEQLIDSLIKLGEKNISEVKDFEKTLVEAKEYLKAVQSIYD